MSILINTAVSALDTPSSLLPFFVKDSFDVTGRTVMANKEGGKHEAREKFIEEAGTSLFWIGGIPAVRAIGKKLVKDKFDTDIDFKRINSDGIQGYFADEVEEKIQKNGKNLAKNLTNKKFSKEDLEGIVLGGEKLGAVKDKLTKSGFVSNVTKGKYKNFHIGLTAASVLINLGILTVAIPKFNQYLSKKIIEKEVSAQNEKPQKNQEVPEKNDKKAQTFGSLSSLKDLFDFKNMFNFTHMAENAQLNVQSSMLLLDYGISGSRVTIVPRNNNERVEYGVKEGGIIVFFYYAADIIKAGLAKAANKIFKTPIDLDYKTLADKSFAEALKKTEKNDLLNFPKLDENDKKSELKIIKFIDNELANKDKNCKESEVFDNFTLKTAQKEGLISVEFDNELGKWIRNSKKYIQTDKLIDLNKNLETFYDSAFEKVKNGTKLEKVISKTKAAKVFSVFGNLAICCSSLSYFLPKLQYMIREHRTNSSEAPGIKQYKDMAQQKQLLA